MTRDDDIFERLDDLVRRALEGRPVAREVAALSAEERPEFETMLRA